jgi:uncharacterized damage-inducible protein DinB
MCSKRSAEIDESMDVRAYGRDDLRTEHACNDTSTSGSRPKKRRMADVNDPDTPEAWLRGPVGGVPDLLQPVAHALVQAREETRRLMQNFPAELLWQRRAGLASAGFHVQHIAGVVDRLFTYARGESLSAEQQEILAREGQPDARVTVHVLLDALDHQVDSALNQLRAMQPQMLTDARAVGRRQLPSTVHGLLFHAAEHAQRHVGQLLVTARVMQESP